MSDHCEPFQGLITCYECFLHHYHIHVFVIITLRLEYDSGEEESVVLPLESRQI